MKCGSIVSVTLHLELLCIFAELSINGPCLRAVCDYGACQGWYKMSFLIN